MRKKLVRNIVIASCILLIFIVSYFNNISGGSFSLLGRAESTPYKNNNNYRPPNTIPVPPPASQRSPLDASNNYASPPIIDEENYVNFEESIQRSEIVQKLPKEGNIEITFFNRLKGYWEAEKTYTLTKNNVKEGSSANSDIKIVMNSRWLSELNENNFCDIVKEAKANQEFDAQSSLSKLGLLWKYKSIVNYRDCLGI